MNVVDLTTPEKTDTIDLTSPEEHGVIRVRRMLEDFGVKPGKTMKDMEKQIRFLWEKLSPSRHRTVIRTLDDASRQLLKNSIQRLL